MGRIDVTVNCKTTKVKGNTDDKLRITFDIQFARYLFQDYQMVPITILHNYSDTTLKQLQQP